MLAAGKSLQLGDLERNDVATVQDVYALVYAGRNKMPGFGKGCAPKGQCTFAARLSDAEVEDVSKYVLDKAKEGW